MAWYWIVAIALASAIVGAGIGFLGLALYLSKGMP